MSLAELCDAAEVTWGALEDRRDGLRLLAALLYRQGARSMRGYEPPSEQLEETLAAETGEEENRRLQVLAFMAQTGGEG